jgi:hypothetical protein
MDQLTNIVLEYIEQRSIKDKAIRRQDYQLAATSRDSEREISRKLYNMLNNIDNNDFLDWNIYENFIKEWFFSEYGITNFNNKDNSIKLINRRNNLNKLI